MEKSTGHGLQQGDGAAAQFLRLYAQVQQVLYVFVLTLVPRRSDADDVLQETMITMWQKFSEFKPGTDFASWAMTIARFKAMSFYKQRKAGTVAFDESLLESLANRSRLLSDELPIRVETLRKCISKLPQDHRHLLEMKYVDGASVQNMSERLGRSVDALYKSISRIHEALHRCMKHSLMEGVGR